MIGAIVMEKWAKLSDDEVINRLTFGRGLGSSRLQEIISASHRQPFVGAGRNGNRGRLDRITHTGFAAVCARIGAR
jgi:hypothetical protein